ncbi:type II secretion system GspH family protein [Bacillus sp. FJAT-49736]|uniref:type II secretion system GspH family protein n=1 Tax=Bacillus sp. FJAT-49736 TaxID=2833582 RepID=UPI001BC8F276|nr:type II secretion system GspH family protein [Bacillus sp. FJAT-49736]MBS4173452.1 type II secretion system protein [Bacillus sp. FJAT-49736]
MFKNEKGFTIAEGLVSFGAIIIVACILFPLMFQTIVKLQEYKETLVAYRFLYEAAEQLMIDDTIFSDSKTLDGTLYNLNATTNNGNWKVCVFYESRQACISAMEK